MGKPLSGARAADRSVHISGTFGVGATVKFRGSNNGTGYVDLTDPLGVAISALVESLFTVLSAAAFVRPEVIGGDGSTSITVSLFIK